MEGMVEWVELTTLTLLISLFFRRITAKEEMTVPNSIRIENSLDIFQTSQRLLGQSLPDLLFVYLHFNIPPYKTKRFGCGNV